MTGCQQRNEVRFIVALFIFIQVWSILAGRDTIFIGFLRGLLTS